MKSKINYFGSAGFIILMGFAAILYGLIILVKLQVMEEREKLFFLFGGPSLLVAIVFIWYKILNEINHITIEPNYISIKNVITRKEQKIGLTSLSGFNDSLFKGRVSLIDNKGKRVVTIYNYCYLNFEELIHATGLKYLGREKSALMRLFKKRIN